MKYSIIPSGNDLPRLGSKPLIRATQKIHRNDPCHCGSGKKFKKCCINVKPSEEPVEEEFEHEFQRYYQAPFWFTEGYPHMIFDKNNNHAIDILVDEITDDSVLHFLDILHGKREPDYDEKVTYKDGYFYGDTGEKIAMIRGWGGLTSSGLSGEGAAKMQDEFAHWIINRLT